MATPIRTLFVSTSTTLGGAEKILSAIALGLDRARFDILGVISLKPVGFYGERMRERGLRVESLGVGRFPGPREVLDLSRRLREANPDLVVAFMYQAIELSRLVKKLPGAAFKLVSSPRVSYRSRGIATLAVDRVLRGEDDLLVAESESSRRHLVERLGYAPEKTAAIPNGVDAEFWAPDAKLRRRVRADLGLDETDFLLGAAGRLDRQKDHATLIRAFAQLSSRSDDRARLAILGEGGERRRLEALIGTLGIGDKARLWGEQHDPKALFCAFDAFVLPSLWEGLPNALLEAMSLGLPVIASRVDGVEDVLTDGHDGLLVTPGDPGALAAALARARAHPSEAHRWGEAARQTIASRFSLPRMISAWSEALSGLF